MVQLAMLLVVVGLVGTGVEPARAAAQATTASPVTSPAPTTTTLVPPPTTTTSTTTSISPTSTLVASPTPTTTTTVLQAGASTIKAPASELSAPSVAGPTSDPPLPGSLPSVESAPGVVGGPPSAAPTGPVPFPAQSLSSPGARALVTSLEAFVARAGRLRSGILTAEVALDGLQRELDQRRRDEGATEVTARQLRTELARAEAQLRDLEAQRRKAVRQPSPPPGTLPPVKIAQRLARAPEELAQRIGVQRQELRRAELSAEDARQAGGAKADEVERQRQTLALLREELTRVPSETDVAAGLAALSDGRGEGPKPSAFALSDIPADYLDLYRRAALTCPGLSWTVLAAIGSAETSHGRSSDPGVRDGANFAGAMGPMQFLAETWTAHGKDGDGDGDADVYHPTDAIFGAANYLCASGAGDPTRLSEAIWAYNHADWYVAAVLSRAAAYGTAGLGIASAEAGGLVDHPNLTLTAEARADLLSGGTDPRVVAALAAAVADHHIAVSVVKTGHSMFVRGTDRVSNHYHGRGVDIYSVDGANVSVSNQAALRLAIAFLSADPSLRPDELGSPWPDLAHFPGAFSDAGHAGHLHLGWHRANPTSPAPGDAVSN